MTLISRGLGYISRLLTRGLGYESTVPTSGGGVKTRRSIEVKKKGVYWIYAPLYVKNNIKLSLYNTIIKHVRFNKQVYNTILAQKYDKISIITRIFNPKLIKYINNL